MLGIRTANTTAGTKAQKSRVVLQCLGGGVGMFCFAARSPHKSAINPGLLANAVKDTLINCRNLVKHRSVHVVFINGLYKGMFFT